MMHDNRDDEAVKSDALSIAHIEKANSLLILLLCSAVYLVNTQVAPHWYVDMTTVIWCILIHVSNHLVVCDMMARSQPP